MFFRELYVLYSDALLAYLDNLIKMNNLDKTNGSYYLLTITFNEAINI